MKKIAVNNALQNILQLHPKGVSVEDLKVSFNGLNAEFSSQAESLWTERCLTGSVNEGCCEGVCKEYCVSYMNENRIWKYVET